eukprot:1160217-Pelagomonas_calceolata.AAC.19
MHREHATNKLKTYNQESKTGVQESKANRKWGMPLWGLEVDPEEATGTEEDPKAGWTLDLPPEGLESDPEEAISDFKTLEVGSVGLNPEEATGKFEAYSQKIP